MTATLGPRPPRVTEPPCHGCRRLWAWPIVHCAWCHRCFNAPSSFEQHLQHGRCADLLYELRVGDRRFHLASVIGVGDVWELR